MRWWMGTVLLVAAVTACKPGEANVTDEPMPPIEDSGYVTGPTDAVVAGAVVDCNIALDTVSADEVCSVTGDPSTATHLLLQGDVLGDVTSYRSGSVLVERGPNALITCVGCDCPAPATTVTVQCPDAVISPGLINPHDHVGWMTSQVSPHTERYDHRHDWRTGDRGDTPLATRSDTRTEAVTYGELRMMLSGATSIVGSGGAPGLLRNLDRPTLNEGLGGWNVDYSTFPLGDADGRLAASGCGTYSPEGDFVLDNRIYMPHVAEGIDAEANNEFQCLSGASGDAADLVADNTSIVHGIGLTAADVTVISERGAHLVWSPRSNLSLYGDTAPVVTYDQVGVPIALGTDWVPSGSSTLLRELACADEFNQLHLGGHFTDRELWLMVTRGPSFAMGADGQLGRIRPGFIADLTVFATGGRDLHRAVLEAQIDDVALVMRGGVPMTGQANLVSSLRSDSSSCEALDSCVSDHVVCMDGGLTLSQVMSTIGTGAYPLYICDAPEDEPTCEPIRNNEDGDGIVYPTSSPTDADLDGVEDDVDNCPDVFNPPRPVDLWMQADEDGDGAGDACDVCPTDAADACSWRDPDGDTLEGLDDNCPDVSNPMQEDTDGDLLGDACDPCPDFPSPQGACPVPITEVKQGQHDGSAIAMRDLIVTAVTNVGFFVQLDPTSSDYTGPDYTGLYVYAPGLDPVPEIGDAILIEGTPTDFFGQVQLGSIARWVRQSADRPLPAPQVATPEDAATGGARAEALEGMLVTVQDTTVTALDLPAGPGDSAPTNEFEVDGALAVDDLLYLLAPPAQKGEALTSLTGILRFGNGASKLNPRALTDFRFGATEVVGLLPDPVYLEAGSSSSALLAVELLRPAGQPETITLSCLPASTLTCPTSVEVPMGEISVSVPLTGGTASVTPATVTASVHSTMATGTVYVYDDSLPRSVVSLSPDPLSLGVGVSESLVVTLNLPAPTGGSEVSLTSGGGTLSTVPDMVTVPAGSLAEAFTVTAGSKEGPDTVTATLDASSVSASIEVAAPGEGLLFTEYLEGSFGNNKFVEITNVDADAIDLSSCDVLVYANGNSSPSNTIPLNSVTLDSGGRYLLCHSSATISTGAACDQSTGSLNFNGNDAVELTCASGLQDVLGQIGVNPGAAWGTTASTANGVLRRNCEVAIGDRDGTDTFVPEDEWTAGTTDDGSNLGLDHCL